MAWDDTSPTHLELYNADPGVKWDTAPPSKEELGSADKSWLDTELPGGTARGYIKGALNALPMAGTVVGGIAGAELGPGALATAGLGGATGEAVKNLGEELILGEKKDRSQIYGDPARGLMEGAGAEAGGQMLGKGIEAAAESGPGKWALQKAGNAAKYLASNLSGATKKEIGTYAANPQAVNELSHSLDNDPQEMADQTRRVINDMVQGHRKTLNDQISTALKSSSKEKTIDVSPIIEHLETQKASLDPSLHPEAIKDIDDLLGRIKGAAPTQTQSVKAYLAPNEKLAIDTGSASRPRTELMNEPPNTPWKAKAGPSGWNENSVPVIESGKEIWPEHMDQIIELPVGGGGTKYLANAQKLHDINKFLQSQASSAYGQSAVGFQVGDKAAQVAKGAAAIGRNILGDVVPEVSQANAGLSRLHSIEDVMNKNMLEEGKTPASLFAAGSGESSSNAKALKQLSAETGENIQGEAEKLAAARTFGNPSLTPVDRTGKSLARMAISGGAGSLIGYKEGGIEGALMGGVIGEGLSSPAAIKLAIDSGLGVKALGKAALETSPALVGKSLMPSIETQGRESAPTPNVPLPPDLTPTKAPTKGPAKWQADGLKNLQDHVKTDDDRAIIENSRSKLMATQKGRDLLVQASDLKPGSRAMDNLVGRIKNHLKGD